MLPSIDVCINLPDVPYRLPSRCATYVAGNRNVCSVKYSGQLCYPSAASRAYTNLEYYTKRKEETKIPQLNLLDEISQQRSQLRLINRKSERMTTINDSRKLVWIDELKQWIVEVRIWVNVIGIYDWNVQKPAVIEFLQLSKKAPMNENDVPCIRLFNAKIRDGEKDFCERFSNHLRQKKFTEPEVPSRSPTMFSNRIARRNVAAPIIMWTKTDTQIKHVQLFNDSKMVVESEGHTKITDKKSENSLGQLSTPEGYEEICNKSDDVLNSVGDEDELYVRTSIGDYKEEVSQSREVIVATKTEMSTQDWTGYTKSSQETVSPHDVVQSTLENMSTIEDVATVLDQTVDQICTPYGIHNTVATVSNTHYPVTIHQTSNEITEEQFKEAVLNSPTKVKPIIRHRVMFNSISRVPDHREIIKPAKPIGYMDNEPEECFVPPSDEEPANVDSEPELCLLSSPPEMPAENEEIIQSSKIPESERDIMAPLLAKPKRRWAQKRLDSSYADQLNRERLAEIRKLKIRKKLEQAVEKSKRNKSVSIPDGPRFESYGFLAKYCILKTDNVGLYKNTFDACDEEKKQWLNNNELIMALKGVNPNMKDMDIAHINMVMTTFDYHMNMGADFKLFSVLAALSTQITTLDSWVKKYIDTSDFRLMQKRTYYCKKLWECLVDPETNTISVNSLCVELKAGGVTTKHINEVQQRLGNIAQLNLIDFLTYIPLFVLIHMSIIDNPLDMTERI